MGSTSNQRGASNAQRGQTKFKVNLKDKKEITICLPHIQVLYKIGKEVVTNHPMVTQASEITLQEEEVVILVLKV
jgi:hypothetical protein